MENLITSLSEYLEEQNYSEYPKVEKSSNETKRFLSRLKKSGIDKLLNEEEIKKISKNLSLLRSEFQNFNDRKSDTAYQIMNFYLFDSYDLILSKFEKFSENFSNKVMEVNQKVSSLESSVQSMESDYTAKSDKLDIALNKAEEIKRKLEKYIQRARDESKKLVADIKSENENELDKQFKHLSLSLESVKKSWNDKFSDLDEKRKRFSKLFDAAEKYYTKDRFNEYSKEEESYANTYRRWSIILMISVVTVAIGLSIASLNNEDGVVQYIMRFLLVFTLMIPAIYTSRESSRHRRNADKYMQMGNELTAFEVTLELEGDNLPPEIKNEIKLEIYKRYFGNLMVYQDRDIGDTFSDFADKMSGKSKDN